MKSFKASDPKEPINPSHITQNSDHEQVHRRLNQNHTSLFAKICPCLSFRNNKYREQETEPYVINNKAEQTEYNLPAKDNNNNHLQTQNKRKYSINSNTPMQYPIFSKETRNQINMNTVSKKETQKSKDKNEQMLGIQSGIRIQFSEDEDYPEMQNQFEQHMQNNHLSYPSMRNKKNNNIHRYNLSKTTNKYPVKNYPENKLIMTGNHKGLLCKIKSINLNPKNEVIVKQKQSNAKKEKQCFDEQIDRYWEKRYYLFERFDQGVMLDHQSWYSVTPEAVAEYMASCLEDVDAVLDAFCGAGGDSIKFANVCQKVYSNDIDQKKIQCLLNNTSIYGVDNIEHMCSDFFQLKLKKDQVQAIYLAPPWGGPNYYMLPTISPQDFTPNLSQIIRKCLKICQNIFMLLPANTDIEALAACIVQCFKEQNVISKTCSLKVDKIYYLGKIKFIAVYLGSLVQKDIKLNEELQFIYNLLSDSKEIKYFKYKRLIRKIREQHGMINLLQYIIESQQNGDREQQRTMETFIESIQSKNLLSEDKIHKIKQLDEEEYQRYLSSMQINKILNKQKEKNIIQGSKIRFQKEKEEHEKTISYISEMSDNQMKMTSYINGRDSLEVDKHTSSYGQVKIQQETPIKTQQSRFTESFNQ